MRKMVEKIIARYGTEVTLRHGLMEYSLRAFFQPVRSKSWSYLNGAYSPLGEVSRGEYVYIGPIDPPAVTGDELEIGGKTYWLRRSEVIREYSGPVYRWGMCVEKGGEDTWGQS